ncbi:site-specific DNA-methyltransferase [Dietzia sp. SLG510A3-30A2]|nr:site-specific DNA-methyltransferase [Dietzia sp. SLG510A3-30A2]
MPNPYYSDDLVTLYHGDCREVLPTIVADSLVTDPPYAIGKNGAMLGFVSANWSEKATHSRGYADHDPQAFAELMRESFALAHDSLPAGATGVAFCGNRTFHQMVAQIEAVGFQPLDVLVFASQGVAKSTTTLAPGHEIASLFRKAGTPRHINPDWKRSNRFDIRKPREEVDHPTPKPVRWMEVAVELASEPGDVVLDPFAGSGATLRAAANLGRKAIGVEMEERYCEVIANRMGQGALDFGAAA